MQFYQQEEYDNLRFLRWWLRTRSFEKRLTLFAFGLGLVFNPILFSKIDDHSWIILAGMIFLAFLGWKQTFAESKKPLVMTKRVKRIFTIGMALQLVFVFCLLWWTKQDRFDSYSALIVFWGIVCAIQCVPLTLVGANLILAPYESIVQRRFLNEAKHILSRIDPFIIGITGSYGKTSTKHILSHILESHAATLATPGSVNTLMGITRVIREKLRDDHQYFIVEMGAYRQGSIRKLCDFTPPKLGIVTAIGLAHMERFKSIETVAKAKSELIQALPADGIAVLNGDDSNCRSIGERIHVNTFFYGMKEELGRLDCRIQNIQTTPEGTRCSFLYAEKEHSIDIPLFGDHQILNASAAFLASVILGVPPLVGVAALRTLQPISHRLVVNRGNDGITVIDDSYNSNPAGFINALNVLHSLPGERKIVITPGMVELGEKKQEEHLRVAAHAVRTCDMIGIVAPHRIPELKTGLIENHFASDKIHEFESLQKAREWLNLILQPGDVVLFENDLPDVYESPSAFSSCRRDGGDTT